MSAIRSPSAPCSVDRPIRNRSASYTNKQGHLEAAEGWVELGNHLEANEELERITAENRAHPAVLGVRWQIYTKLALQISFNSARFNRPGLDHGTHTFIFVHCRQSSPQKFHREFLASSPFAHLPFSTPSGPGLTMPKRRRLLCAVNPATAFARDKASPCLNPSPISAMSVNLLGSRYTKLLAEMQL